MCVLCLPRASSLFGRLTPTSWQGIKRLVLLIVCPPPLLLGLTRHTQPQDYYPSLPTPFSRDMSLIVNCTQKRSLALKLPAKPSAHPSETGWRRIFVSPWEPPLSHSMQWAPVHPALDIAAPRAPPRSAPPSLQPRQPLRLHCVSLHIGKPHSLLSFAPPDHSVPNPVPPHAIASQHTLTSRKQVGKEGLRVQVSRLYLIARSVARCAQR